MHGDGGAFSHNDSLFVLTFNSLLGRGNTRSTRFFMTVVPKSEIVEGTLSTIMTILAWSFNVLLTGIHPIVDFLGNEVEEVRGFIANK